MMPGPQKMVLELCLVCRGERWMLDPADPARSIPCPYCDEQGWVQVSAASLGEHPTVGGPESAAPANPKPGAARKKA